MNGTFQIFRGYKSPVWVHFLIWVPIGRRLSRTPSNPKDLNHRAMLLIILQRYVVDARIEPKKKKKKRCALQHDISILFGPKDPTFQPRRPSYMLASPEFGTSAKVCRLDQDAMETSLTYLPRSWGIKSMNVTTSTSPQETFGLIFAEII